MTGSPRSPWRARLATFGRARRLLLVVAGAVLVVSGAGYVAWQLASAPGVTSLRAAGAARPSVMMSADGQLLARFGRAQQEPVPLTQVSPAVLDALVATEDHRFRQHRGVDWRRSAAAVWHTLTGQTQGGSTITQQLARNLFPQQIGRERTLGRKLREIATALRIERHFSKDQILEAYLNSAPFLYNVVGIEMAARTYFDKPAAALDRLEAATLVGMLKGTAYYNPVRHPERALARRNTVLQQMVRNGALPASAAQALAARPLQVLFKRPVDPAEAAPHFVAQARKQALEWADENDRDLYREGLVIETTLDMRLQAAAVRAVEQQARALQAVADVEWSQPRAPAGGSLEGYARLAARSEPFAFFWSRQPQLLREAVRASPEYRERVAAGHGEAAALQALLADKAWIARLKATRTRLEAGFVALDPASGAVRAWVGSRDHDIDQFDHVAQAQRQPGSTFKPFVYAAALESGMSPLQTYVDGAVEVALPDGKVWRPTDMSGASDMPLTLREGLAQSKNTITVQVAQDVGIGRVAALARAMGVESRLDVVPSLALGTSPVTLLELVGAYTGFANRGEARKPYLLERVAERDGTVLAEFGPAPARRALGADTAIMITDMMRDGVNRGTGTALRARVGSDVDVAGKTGTTQDNADGWFVALHPNLVSGAWVGFNDQRVTMRSNYWGQGGHNAVLIVGDFLRSALRDRLIDRKAAFPTPPRPRPPDEEAIAAPPEPAGSTPPTQPTEPAASGAGPGVAAPAARGFVTLPAPPGAADPGPPKSAHELDRVVDAIERASALRNRGARAPAFQDDPVPRAPASGALAPLAGGASPPDVEPPR